ncbi:type III secretion system translocator chaperone SicA [Serratia silvae]|uniref:Type III secretion system translocator chaperone SicA n=1 Tax=Serratia silvae TaxID=2824122 RepID=A0ABT0K9U2_9GAMM|nr:type III secretion system translocator chaperone SicA [Serratia silvae]MCL1028788.1 type III secretion system translocator chaperone SicA [Serratia silvae]
MIQKTGDLSANEMEQMILLVMNGGATLKEVHGISEDAMENIYAHAYQCYQSGKLHEAERFFKFLCMYDLKNPDYFIGLGAVYQLSKNYLKACDIYALAYVLADKNFIPVFFSGQCQLLLGNIAKALQCFDIIIRRCEDETLIKRAVAYSETIRKNHAESMQSNNGSPSEEDAD